MPTFRPRSALRFSKHRLVDGVTFWDPVEIPEIPVQADDFQYTVVQNDRIDLLAKRFYGEHGLWKIIAKANDMELLPNDMYTGQRLRIPSPRYIKDVFYPQKKTF